MRAQTLFFSCALAFSVPVPTFAQAVGDLETRARADSAFLERVLAQSTGSTAAMMQDSVRIRLAALDSTFDMLVQGGNADAALRFASAMNAHWTRFGGYSRSLAQYRHAFAISGSPSSARAAALNQAAFLAFRQRDQKAAIAFNEEALRVAEQIGDSAASASAHIGLGRIAARKGDYAATQRHAQEAVRIRDLMGNPRGKVGAYHLLAFAMRLQKRYEEAARLYEFTIGLYGIDGNRARTAEEMFNLGFVRLHQQDTTTAARLFRESLSALRALNQPNQMYLLGAFAALATVQKQPRRAALLWGAMAAALDRANVTLDPDDQVEIDTYLPLARNQMKAADFDAARADGRKLSLEDAVTLALEKQ